MSKMDNLRAMREAKYAEAQKRSSRRRPRPKAAAPVAPPAPAAKKAAPDRRGAGSRGDQPATEELCGHRNMSGRTCTRERGHAAKSHRYS